MAVFVSFRRFWRDHRLLMGFILVVMLALAATIAQLYGRMLLAGPATLALLCWLTAVVTRHGGDAAPAVRGRAVWAQLLACATVFIATGLEGARLDHALPAGFQARLLIAGAVAGSSAMPMMGLKNRA